MNTYPKLFFALGYFFFSPAFGMEGDRRMPDLVPADENFKPLQWIHVRSKDIDPKATITIPIAIDAEVKICEIKDSLSSTVGIDVDKQQLYAVTSCTYPLQKSEELPDNANFLDIMQEYKTTLLVLEINKLNNN